MAKKNLNWDAKKVVICHMIGKSKMPNSPNSRVKNPKKLILIADKRITKKGNTNEINIKTLLAVFDSSFCNSRFNNRIMG
jgi:hypothetical protein